MELKVVKGSIPGQILALEKETFTIGRVEDNDFIIDEAGVSRHHCTFSRVGTEWSVEDLQSVNGVLVNGKKLDGPQVVHVGDEITVYNHVFKLQDPQEVIPLSADNPFGNDVLVEDEESEGASNKVILGLKIGILVIIVAAIAVLAYILLSDSSSEGENVADGEAVSAASVVSAEEPSAESGDEENRSQRGESLLGGEGSVGGAVPVAVAGEPEQSTPPPPPPAAEPTASKDEEDDDLDETESTGGKPAGTGFGGTSERGDDGGVAARAPVVPAAVPVQRSRVLVVKSVPSGAHVSVNGRIVGETPVVVDGIEEEEVSLELTKPGYERLTKLMNVSDADSSRPFELVQKVGTVVVTTNPPGVTVSEGPQVHGVTPLLLEGLAPGKHEFTLERKGYESKKASVTLTESAGAQVEETLSSTLGSLEVVTVPAGCQVSVNGYVMGTTEASGDALESKPFLIENLSSGQCTVRVLHPETKQYSVNNKVIVKGQKMTHRSFIWIPTHKVVLIDGSTVVGMMLRRSGDEIDVLTVANKRERFIKEQYRELVEVTPEDAALILKNRASGRGPSEQMSTQSSVSLLVKDFLQQVRYPSFQGYIKKKVCVTGDVTMRMKTPKGIIIQFGKQLRCILAPTAPADDYRKIGELEDKKEPVSLRGVYEGKGKDGVYTITNCVLLPYPD